jgi:hypothetical protein
VSTVDRPKGETELAVLNVRSLASTLDAVNDALFFGHRIPRSESSSAARWVAGRQGLPGSYAGMFAPTSGDFARGIRLFTGERITTRAATGHILGEEACRALLLLNAGGREVRDALGRASDAMDRRLSESESEQRRRGFF